MLDFLLLIIDWSILKQFISQWWHQKVFKLFPNSTLCHNHRAWGWASGVSVGVEAYGNTGWSNSRRTASQTCLLNKSDGTTLDKSHVVLVHNASNWEQWLSLSQPFNSGLHIQKMIPIWIDIEKTWTKLVLQIDVDLSRIIHSLVNLLGIQWCPKSYIQTGAVQSLPWRWALMRWSGACTSFKFRRRPINFGIKVVEHNSNISACCMKT